MKCREVIELLSVCNETELTKPDRIAIESHLAHCKCCRQESELLHAMQRKLRTGFQTREINAPDMTGAIMASLPHKPTVSPFFGRWNWAAASASLAVCLLAFFWLINRAPLPVSKQTAQTKHSKVAAAKLKPSAAAVIHSSAPKAIAHTKSIVASKDTAQLPLKIVKLANEPRKEKPTPAKQPDETSAETIAELNTPCVQFSLPGVDPTRADDELALNTRPPINPANRENQ